jgi:hypothetical protein
MQSSSDRTGSAPALLAFSLQPSAFSPRGARHRANAGGSTPSPSLSPAPRLFLLCAVLLTGCASTPTRLEQKLFDVRTNQIPSVVLVTNIVPVYAQAGIDGRAQASPVSWRTNITVTTNLVEAYTYTPKLSADQLASATSLLGPWGQLLGVILGGVIGAYGLIRSSRATKTAGVLAQVIETGRQVLQATPQGQALDAQWKTWMIQHQAEQGVMSDVVKLLNQAVDEPSAKITAQDLLALMNK